MDRARAAVIKMRSRYFALTLLNHGQIRTSVDGNPSMYPLENLSISTTMLLTLALSLISTTKSINYQHTKFLIIIQKEHQNRKQ